MLKNVNEFQTGDMIITRSLTKGIYIEKIKAFISDSCYFAIGNYLENGDDCQDPEDDIIFAWRPRNGNDCCSDYLWIRKYYPEMVLIDKLDPPKEEIFKEMTMAEIEEALGCKIKVITSHV